MKRLTTLFLTLIAVLAFSGVVFAQQEIPEGKRKLIAELMELTNAKSEIIRVTDSMLETMEAMYPLMLGESLKDSDLNEEDREALAKIVSERHKDFSEKFRKRLPQVIDYDDYIVKAAYPIYNRYFTEKELSEMVEFYKTETGKKVISTLPQLSDDMKQEAEEYMTPKLMKLVEEILEETFPKEGPVIEDGPPPPPAPRKKG